MLRVCLVTTALAVGISTAPSDRPLATQAQSGPAHAVDIGSLGPRVGANVPDFSLPDQRGAIRSLKSLMGPKGVLLVFFRSADW